MATIIEMPKLSDTMSVGTLVKWHKEEGDSVENGDTLAEVETDKATMELENFEDGVLLKIFVSEGSEVPIGSPLAVVGAEGEEIPEISESPASKTTKEKSSKYRLSLIEKAVDIIEKSKESLEFEIVVADPNVSKISVVGSAMRSQPGVAKTMFEILAAKGVNIQVISTSEIKISVLIDVEYTELAVRSLHTAFGLDDG